MLEKITQHHLTVIKDFVNHLYPEEKIERWNIPHALPEISASHALQLLKHLDQLPISHHPAIQFVHLKAVHDFRLSQAKINTVYGPMSELLLHSGIEPVMRLHGPTIFIRALYANLQDSIGKPWSEISKRIYLPADAALVNAQVQEFIKITSHELAETKKCVELQNSIFSVLFGITNSLKESEKLQTLRRHLSNDDNRVALQIQKIDFKAAVIKTEDFAGPRGLLQ